MMKPVNTIPERPFNSLYFMRAVLKFIIPETQKLHQAKSILYSLLFFEIFFATDACAYV